MSIRVVADTHAILWYFYDDARLSTTAAMILDAAAQAGDQIAIASITLAEIVYLIEKGRIHRLAFERILGAIEQANPTLVEIPLDRTIIGAMRQLDRLQVPDLPDRIIAATGLYLQVPVISRDHKIRASSVATIW